MRKQLISKQFYCFSVFLIARYLIQQQQLSTVVEVINIVLIGLITLYATIVLHVVVHTFLDVIEIAALAGSIPNIFNPFQHHTLIVPPFGHFIVVQHKRIGPDGYGCLHHTF